jgi:hypothetical protein
MSSTSKQVFYGVLAVIGLFVTWHFNLQAMAADPDFSLVSFVKDNYVNPSSASIMNDIAVVCVAFFFWSYFEAQKLGMRFWFAYVPLTLLVALAVSLPVFLLMRERALANSKTG